MSMVDVIDVNDLAPWIEWHNEMNPVLSPLTKQQTITLLSAELCSLATENYI